MTDSHAHLTISPISDIVENIVGQFVSNGGKKILNVAYDPESIQLVLQQKNLLDSKYPGVVLNALGVHPEHFSENLDSEGFSIFDRAKRIIDSTETILLENAKSISAIGETGLDYFHIFKDESLTPQVREQIMEAQKNSFKRHAEIALKLNLPLTIHTRDLPDADMATVDALHILAEVGKGRLRGSFHSYTGKKEHVGEIIALGFHIGFNGIITYPSAKNVVENLKETSDEKILTETDCPLLPVQSVRSDRKREDRYARPSDVKEILGTLAEIKGYTVEKIESICDENFSHLFFSN